MDEAERSKAFVLHFARHENDLFRYVLTLLPNWNDAEDVMQDTATALWQHFGDYDPQRPFLPWACQFAYFHVRNFRSRQKTRSKVFGDTLVELLADERSAHLPAIEQQRAALDACLGKLRETDRELIQRRYGSNEDLGAAARRSGQTPNALYKALQRIRKQLMDCVSHSMAAEA